MKYKDISSTGEAFSLRKRRCKKMENKNEHKNGDVLIIRSGFNKISKLCHKHKISWEEGEE